MGWDDFLHQLDQKKKKSRSNNGFRFRASSLYPKGVPEGQPPAHRPHGLHKGVCDSYDASYREIIWPKGTDASSGEGGGRERVWKMEAEIWREWRPGAWLPCLQLCGVTLSQNRVPTVEPLPDGICLPLHSFLEWCLEYPL